jgi:hypothetical protein
VVDLVLVRLHPLSSQLLKWSAKIERRCNAKFLTVVTAQLVHPDTVLLSARHVFELRRWELVSPTMYLVCCSTVMIYCMYCWYDMCRKLVLGGGGCVSVAAGTHPSFPPVS